MTKYDDFDFHVGHAVEQGRAEDSAFTHIGFMLAWLIEHDLANSRYFPPSIVQQVKDGSLRPNDLRDLVDGQLLSITLKRAGSAFLDAYYGSGYGADFEAEFGDLPQYGVPDDAEHKARIGRRIDAAWDRWDKAGRPKLGQKGALWTETDDTDVLTGMLESLMTGTTNPQTAGAAHRPIMSGRIDMLPKEHVDLELEACVSRALGGGVSTESSDARQWGSSVLNRLLTALGVLASEAVVATAMGAQPADPRVEVYRIPGINGGRLLNVFQDYFTDRARKWRDGPLGSIHARWAVSKYAGLPDYTLVWFAVDGYVVHIVSPDRSAVEEAATAIANELPGQLAT